MSLIDFQSVGTLVIGTLHLLAHTDMAAQGYTWA